MSAQEMFFVWVLLKVREQLLLPLRGKRKPLKIQVFILFVYLDMGIYRNITANSLQNAELKSYATSTVLYNRFWDVREKCFI